MNKKVINNIKKRIDFIDEYIFKSNTFILYNYLYHKKEMV
jgi:hypothetical protein